jgi:hypothetical protein
MKRLLLSFGRLPGSVLPMLALVALGSLTSIGVGAEAAPTKATTPGTVANQSGV